MAIFYGLGFFKNETFTENAVRLGFAFPEEEMVPALTILKVVFKIWSITFVQSGLSEKVMFLHP